jgi:hypothetical protein
MRTALRCLPRPGADESGPPGDVNDTRFLKGLRLGAADESAAKQYTAMGIWRRLATLVGPIHMYTYACYCRQLLKR